MSSSLYGYASGYKPKKRPTTNRRVPGTGYSPAAYVPGGSTQRVATAIQSKGGKRPQAYKPPRAPSAPQQRPPAPAPKPTPQAQAAPSFSYDQDPVLQRLQSLGAQDRSVAQAEATAAKKQVAIDYGDDAYARNVLGDEGTATAAAGNPLGVRQQLKKQYDEGVQGFEQGLDSELFYSGYRGDQLGKLGTGYQEGLAGAGRQEQDLLSQIERLLTGALNDADRRDAEAEAEAAQRAIDSGYGGIGEQSEFSEIGGIAEQLGQSFPWSPLEDSPFGVLAGAQVPPAPRAAGPTGPTDDDLLAEQLRRIRLGQRRFE